LQRNKVPDQEADDKHDREKSETSAVEKDTTSFTKRDKIMKTISDNDKGKGVSVDDIKSSLVGDYSDEEVSSVIKTLLRDGEIYELSPGIIRLL